jgi:extracellular factor (EF) 3-hydroxypalmitic acid methyl ester biosynthesis protein
MKSLVDRFFAEPVPRFIDEMQSLEESTSADASPAFDATLDRVTKAIIASEDACRDLEQRIQGDGPLLQEARQRFRDEIAPWFDQSWFMNRGKNKPRGYPGDYLLLSGIYDNKPKGTGLGGYLDLFFLNTTLAVAVRERLSSVRRFLLREVRDQPKRQQILNVACGPCREYSHGWNARGRAVSVTLVDVDLEALAFSDQALAIAAPTGFEHQVVAYNALRMSSAKNNISRFGRPDIIYSIGLCDYIPDNYLIRILRGWRESLADDGVIYVAFKDAQKYDSACYAWHVDWHFVGRTDSDCRRLFEKAGYDMDRLEMNRSRSAVIMNYAYRESERVFSPIREQATLDAGIPTH